MRILNLGAGVQSTTLFLMAHEGVIPPIDHAIFADTQEEPEAVYQHLAWLRTVPAPVPILHVATTGRLGDDLIREEQANRSPEHRPFKYREHQKHRFASIPCYTAKLHTERAMRDACAEGMVQRQCTKEYKVEVIDRVIRRTILGLEPRQRIPKPWPAFHQMFGISEDERRRSKRIKERYEAMPWATVGFPLLDLGMTRDDCKRWLAGRVPHETPRSACVFCPYKSAEEWQRTKANPTEWARAVEIDRALRDPGRLVNRRMELAMYLHRDCVPLEEVDLEAAAVKERARKRRPLFDLMECGEGMCGV